MRFGIRTIYRKWQLVLIPIVICYAYAFTSFINAYFSTYQEQFGESFFYSFKEALEYAMEKTEGTIYVTDKQKKESSIVTLFYSKLSPDKFYNTVKYRDDNAEIRKVTSFDRYVFEFPENKDDEAVYVVLNSEVEEFDTDVFDFEHFYYYTVVYPKN